MHHCYVDYIKKLNILDEGLDIDFSDSSFAYDYNEVQELFFDEKQNYFVFLVGETGLKKKEMLGRICQDIVMRGVDQEDILYLDYDLPILHGENIYPLLDDFHTTRSESSQLYLIVNEIQEFGDWLDFVLNIRKRYPMIKLLCSSSTPPYIYETFYDHVHDFCKIIVLSAKNDSNIKYQSDAFGVYEEFKYNQKNGLIEIKGLTKEGKKLHSHRIPKAINGLPVKVISSGAFHDRAEMLSISIPDTVEMIGDYAFSKCSSLKEITLPKSLKYIGDHSFLGAKSLKNIYGGENVEHIGNSAFYATEWIAIQSEFAILGKCLYKYLGCTPQVNVPPDVFSVSSYAFAKTNVENVNFFNNDISFGEGVFYKCQKLKNINVSLKVIRPFMFYNCTNLTMRLKVDAVEKYGLYGCTNIDCLDAGYIGICALSHSKNLKTLHVKDHVDVGGCFGLAQLKTFDFGNIKFADKFSFSRTALEEVVFYGDKIEDFAFGECGKIGTVVISPKTKLGKSIFYLCESITKMDVSGMYKLRWYFGLSQFTIKELTIHGDIVDDFNRNNSHLLKLTIIGTKKFGRWSFYNNSELSDISFIDVHKIGDWAFAYSDKIERIVFPPTVKYLGMNAFRYCHSLSQITIQSPDVIRLGANVFYSTCPQKIFFVPELLKSKYEEIIHYGGGDKEIKIKELTPLGAHQC